jgi:hypothetical protein
LFTPEGVYLDNTMSDISKVDAKSRSNRQRNSEARGLERMEAEHKGHCYRVMGEDLRRTPELEGQHARSHDDLPG